MKTLLIAILLSACSVEKTTELLPRGDAATEQKMVDARPAAEQADTLLTVDGEEVDTLAVDQENADVRPDACPSGTTQLPGVAGCYRCGGVGDWCCEEEKCDKGRCRNSRCN